jgi:hypothetical protein
MSKRKHHRSDASHDQRDAADRPQSTDVADLDGGAADQSSAHQRKEGRHRDERYSSNEDVASDVQGRILKVDVVKEDDREVSRIVIGLGHDQGIFEDMEGYVKAGDGMLADFHVSHVKERTCVATVAVTPDQLREHHQVVLNPTSKPKSSEVQANVDARIIGLRIEGGKTKILIGRGASHGARDGMIGYVVDASGRNIADFTIEKANPTHSEAFVALIPDQVSHAAKVVLNPS